MQHQVRYFRAKGMKVGANFRAMSDFTVSEPFLVEIGDDVTISNNVSFITHDNSISRYINNGTDIFGRIKIGNNCFIGNKSIIMPGVELGDNIVVGAGSVVTKSFKQGSIIIAGNPAKKIKNLNEFIEENSDRAFNMRGLSAEEKEKVILSKPDKIISK